MMGLGAFIAVSAILFGIGIVCIITRRNMIYVLMGIEMILNAANINFVAFNRFNGDAMDGRMFAIFVIILAAAEAAVALGIVLNVYHLFESIKPSDVDLMRD
ncbi:MAG: NADH-quinone oxidoreductase subunit NuoK [Planctomycetota bacterium]|nr:NADH-quinone oxidoreductase subunit NuoK [Planctomycetota bacterium]